MSKYYYFREEITVESVNNLIEKLQDVEGKINLWFSTEGGDTNAMICLIEFFNSRKDNLIIYLNSYIWSAGTLILSHFKGKINIEHLDNVLFHVSDRERNCLRNNRPINENILQKQDKQFNKKFAKIIKNKNLLTDKQLKKFIKGEDVIVYKKQIKTWNLFNS